MFPMETALVIVRVTQILVLFAVTLQGVGLVLSRDQLLLHYQLQLLIVFLLPDQLVGQFVLVDVLVRVIVGIVFGQLQLQHQLLFVFLLR